MINERIGGNSGAGGIGVFAPSFAAQPARASGPLISLKDTPTRFLDIMPDARHVARGGGSWTSGESAGAAMAVDPMRVRKTMQTRFNAAKKQNGVTSIEVTPLRSAALQRSPWFLFTGIHSVGRRVMKHLMTRWSASPGRRYSPTRRRRTGRSPAPSTRWP